MPGYLGIRAYARHRAQLKLAGATHHAVQKAIAAGRLSRSVVRDGEGTVSIDPALADVEWNGATDPAQVREGGAQGTLFPGAAAARKPAVDDGSASKYSTARAARETFRAQMAALELRQRRGELVDVATTKSEAFRIARTVRDQLLGVSARVAPLVAASSDVRECERIVAREIELACRELSGSVARTG